MNQSILFPELQTWQEDKQQIVFIAQQSGLSIDCIITVASLSQLKGENIVGEEQALHIFSEYRFDIEELAEQLIEDEDFNHDGQIEIKL